MTAPPLRREDLISRQAAAHTLGIHVNTMDREAKKLGLKKYRVRGDSQVFFLRSEIDGIEPIEEIRS